MATATAASARNFSTMGVIRFKPRNSLSPDTVRKLVFINLNLGTFYDSPKADRDENGRHTDSDIDDNNPA